MISIIGMPYDDESSFLKGASHAPPIIRNAFKSDSSNTYAESEIDVGEHPEIRDLGDLDLGSGQNARDQIEAAIRNQAMEGAKVLSLGGDHSITYPILKGYASKHGKINVLQFDAHSDLYEEFDGKRYSHACQFTRAHEDGIVNSHLQVGVRTINEQQRKQIDKYDVQVVNAKDFSETLIEVDGPVYITLDLDVFEPGLVPGISHYEPGGLTVRDVVNVIQDLEVPVIGADIVEYNPKRDINEITAMVAAKFMKELLSKMLSDI